MSKPFNLELFRHDKPARKAIKMFFAMRRKYFTDNKDQFGVDLIGFNTEFAIEVETREKWTEGSFPYDVVNVLDRKREMLLSRPTYLMITDASYSKAIALSPKTLKKYLTPAHKRELVCRVPTEGTRTDFVYRVPASEAKEFALN